MKTLKRFNDLLADLTMKTVKFVVNLKRFKDLLAALDKTVSSRYFCKRQHGFDSPVNIKKLSKQH